MKKRTPKVRNLKVRNLADRFRSTCGYCGKTIPPNSEVFGGTAKVHSGVDLSDKAGQVIELYLAGEDKILLVAVPGIGSPARAEGHDLVFMTCSRVCGDRLYEALADEMRRGNETDSA